jgi:hypothetical protein
MDSRHCVLMLSSILNWVDSKFAMVEKVDTLARRCKPPYEGQF